MNHSKRHGFVWGVGLIVAFILWTVLIQTVDVRPVGVNGTNIGFTAVNTWFHRLTGVHMGLYTVTDWLGLVPISVCIGFGLLGLFLPKALNIGAGVAVEMAEAEVQAAEFTSVLDTLKNLIPANPFASFANGNMLQVLAFAIIIGITCLVLGPKAEPFVKLCEAVDHISVKIISAVMYTTPVGVFCSLAGTVHVNGLQTILSLAAVLGTLYLVMLLYIVIVYGLVLVKGIGKFSLKRFFVTALPAALNAFGTASSSATLPISKRCTDEMEVPNEISSLALPLGATINMDAVSIVMSFMIVFFANATGTDLPYGLLAVVLLSNTLLSIGAPGVPNSAIASFAALAAIAGLPAGIMGMYVSVNILVDAGATCCNVLGDIASAVAMKRTCRLHL